MKKILYTVLLCLGILSTLFIQSCKPDEEPCNDPRNKACPNYNPCLDAKETSAAFTMEENVVLNLNRRLMAPNHFIRYDTDTCKRWNDIIFTCTQKADSIWWIFEDDEMRPQWQQKQSFSIKFGSPRVFQTQPEQVKIRCIVKNNKPNPCIPNDNGIDTFTRYMVYMPVYQAGFIGTYSGSLSSNPDSVFKLTLKFDSLVEGQVVYSVYIAFDELLTEPPYESPTVKKGHEYSINGSGRPDYGYNRAYIFFNSVSGEPIVSPNYNGKTVKGIVFYNSQTNILKIDFIRHGTGIYSINEWPPKNIPLLTFTGNKIK